jgi:hypothetical protein
MIDVAGRNMDTGFDFAIGLAGARNLGEVMELQAAYWHKLGARVAAPIQNSRCKAKVVAALPGHQDWLML